MDGQVAVGISVSCKVWDSMKVSRGTRSAFVVAEVYR